MWPPIEYPQALYDERAQVRTRMPRSRNDLHRFTRDHGAAPVTDRLIVRRVQPRQPAGGQSELFATWRYHACFTDSTEPLVAAESQHREHTIVKQVFADLKDSALAHLPSGNFAATSSTCPPEWPIRTADPTASVRPLALTSHLHCPVPRHPAPVH